MADAATAAALATATCYLAARRARDVDLLVRRLDHGDDAVLRPVTLDATAASFAAIAASIGLLLLFYFFQALAWLLLVSTVLTATAGLVLLLAPWLARATERASKRLAATAVPLPCGLGTADVPTALAAAVAVGASVLWLWTSHWVLNNALAVGLVVMFVTLGRVPSGRVAAILLFGLLLYDVFWSSWPARTQVYVSPYLFAENVMVSVATRTAANPLAKLADAVRVSPPPSLARSIAVPAKLVLPSWSGYGGTILGLGDIAVPGLLVSLFYRHGWARQGAVVPLSAAGTAPWRQPFLYFYLALAGYAAGVLLTMAVALHWDAAQPALLFLVPCTVLPVVLAAAARRDLGRLWATLPDDPGPDEDDGFKLDP